MTGGNSSSYTADSVQQVNLAPTPMSLIIPDNNGQPLVTIRPDGILTYGPNYSPDEAAKAFWEAMAGCFPGNAAVVRVRALHQPYRSVYDEGDDRSCAHCNQYGGYAVPWPCDTIRALDGEQA